MLTKEQLVGTWKIESCEARFLDGRIGPHPTGENAVGYLIYSMDGYMSLEIMATKPHSFTKEDPFSETHEGHEGKFNSHLSYTASYEIVEDRIVHLVELTSYSDFVGKKIERYVRMEDQIMYQTTQPFFIQGESQTVHLVLSPVKVCAESF